MTYVGLIRTSTKGQDVHRQHNTLEPVCEYIFEEKDSDTLMFEKYPELRRALDHLCNGDVPVAQEVDRLGRNLPWGLAAVSEIFERDITVNVLESNAAGKHSEWSFILQVVLAPAKNRHRDINRKTKDGLQATRNQESIRGQPLVVDDDKLATIKTHRKKDENIREVARPETVNIFPPRVCTTR